MIVASLPSFFRDDVSSQGIVYLKNLCAGSSLFPGWHDRLFAIWVRSGRRVIPVMKMEIGDGDLGSGLIFMFNCNAHQFYLVGEMDPWGFLPFTDTHNFVSKEFCSCWVWKNQVAFFSSWALSVGSSHRQMLSSRSNSSTWYARFDSWFWHEHPRNWLPEFFIDSWTSPEPGWWFQFFMFTPNPGEMIQFDQCFSNGL